MSSHHHASAELDSGTINSLTSSPRSDHHSLNDDTTTIPRVRFMCSFGGKILPRPHDNQLRYVGGDTRIIAVNRHTTFASFLHNLSKLSGTTNITVKYQLPNEDLDALITVTTDDDVDNMIEEYDRLAHNNKMARLRLFLFPPVDAVSRASSISSLLDGSTKRGHWFLDALNGAASPTSGSGLERGRSEASSIVSEVPDYLFGLDNSDDPPRETRLKTRSVLGENVPGSDPGSPDPIVSSPFCSTSSSLAPPYFPDLPSVKTKSADQVPAMEQETHFESSTQTGEAAIPQQTGYMGNPMRQYVPDSHYPSPAIQNLPVYYVPGPVSQGNVPIQSMPIQASYGPPFPAHRGQIPIRFPQPVPGMGQVYGGGGVRPVVAMDPYDMSGRVGPDGMSQPVYYGVRNTVMVPNYPGMMVPGGEELQGTGTNAKVGRISPS